MIGKIKSWVKAHPFLTIALLAAAYFVLFVGWGRRHVKTTVSGNPSVGGVDAPPIVDDTGTIFALHRLRN